MKWTKTSAFEWEVVTQTTLARIAKVSGNHGYPYMWGVYPLPRPEVRWTPLAKGSERKLAHAKASAEQFLAG